MTFQISLKDGAELDDVVVELEKLGISYELGENAFEKGTFEIETEKGKREAVAGIPGVERVMVVTRFSWITCISSD